MDISIIIPTHNRLWCLPGAIASCRQNHVCNYEIIVIDDGSTDGTWDWLKEQKDIIAIRQENWGKPWAVNLAFQYAKGKYIKFLDSDDWLKPYCLDQQFSLAEKSSADLVVSGYDVYQNQKFIKTQKWIPCDDFIAQQLGECDSSHYSAFLFKKDFIKDIPHRTSFAAADFASRDDRCFMLEVALKKPHYVIMEKPVLCHRHHERGRLQFQQSLKAIATNFQHWLIYKNILSQLEKSGELTERRKNAAIKILWPLAHWVSKDDLAEGEKIYQFIIKLNSEFSIPEKGILRKIYKELGFKRTEQLLKCRRIIKQLWA